MTNRNYMWDNIKGFLIITVVVGHFLHSFNCFANVPYNIAYWIYTFHMPAFLFVSGYWAKGYCKNGVIKPKKVAYLIGYYTIFHLLFFFIDLIFLTPNKQYTLLDAMIGLWYLAALILYYLTLPLFEKLKPYIGIPIVFLLGFLIGWEPNAGNFLSLSRTFVFAPFFFIGYYSSEKAIEKLRSIKFSWLWGILSMLASVPLWLFANMIFPDNLLYQEIINPYLFYGHANYQKLHLEVYEGFLMRAVAYLIASLMILGILLVAPKCKSFLCHLGKNSLQIYLFHLIPILIFVRLKGQGINLLIIDNEWIGLTLIVVAILLTILLSLKPFSYPFKWIRSLVDKIYSLSTNEK